MVRSIYVSICDFYKHIYASVYEFYVYESMCDYRVAKTHRMP